MATSSLRDLESVLAEKARILEAVRERLAAGQRCIIEADTRRLDKETHQAEEGFNRLSLINNRFRTILARSVEELGLPEQAQLSTIISALEPERRSHLQELQKRCISVAGSISLLLSMNEDLLKNSLDIVGRSLTLFGNFLKGEETYGAAGRMTNSGTAAGIICREIKI